MRIDKCKYQAMSKNDEIHCAREFSKIVNVVDCAHCLKARQKKYNRMMDITQHYFPKRSSERERNYVSCDLHYGLVSKIDEFKRKCERDGQKYESDKFFVQIQIQHADKFDTFLASHDDNFGSALKIDYDKLMNLLLENNYNRMSSATLEKHWNKIPREE